MNISQIMEKMIAFSNGNLHDMNHLMCVWTYAKTIGELEGLDRKTQETLEIAAITHDIACPLCRKLPLKIFTPVSISTTPKILRDTAFPFPTW